VHAGVLEPPARSLMMGLLRGGRGRVGAPSPAGAAASPPSSPAVSAVAATVAAAAASGPTGATPWRPAPVVHARGKNELYISVNERISAVLPGNGGPPRSLEVAGALRLRARLAGMPRVRLGINDAAAPASAAGAGPRVRLEAVALHPSVGLSSFEARREIACVPPEGDFELLSYRVLADVRPPLSLRAASSRLGRHHYRLTLALRSACPRPALGVRVHVPLPPHADRVLPRPTGGGRPKVDAAAGEVRWKFRELLPGAAASLEVRRCLLAMGG